MRQSARLSRPTSETYEDYRAELGVSLAACGRVELKESRRLKRRATEKGEYAVESRSDHISHHGCGVGVEVQVCLNAHY